jgi:nuclear pore complex protein Nup155
MAELPAMVKDKYRTCQAMCFCGVFPEIRRAWASVDSSLFLWRYDRARRALLSYGGGGSYLVGVVGVEGSIISSWPSVAF